MTEKVETIGGLFYDDPESMDAEDRQKIEESPKVRDLGETIKEEAPEMDSSNTTSLVMRAAGVLLGIGLYDEIFAKAWIEKGLFRKYLDPTMYNPKERITLSLRDHQISTSHEPKIEIKINDRVVTTIDFKVTVSFDLQGGIVDLIDGHIVQIGLGSCSAAGTLMCEGVPIRSRQLGSVDILKSKEFDPGLPIDGSKRRMDKESAQA